MNEEKTINLNQVVTQISQHQGQKLTIEEIEKAESVRLQNIGDVSISGAIKQNKSRKLNRLLTTNTLKSVEDGKMINENIKMQTEQEKPIEKQQQEQTKNENSMGFFTKLFTWK